MHRIEWIRRRVTKEDKILDVGCADNAVWGGLPQVTTLDKSTRPNEQCFPNMLALAEYLPFKSKVFDVATCNEILEHVTDPQKVLREALRVAKRKIIVTVPNEFLWPPELKPFWNPGHVRFYNEESFRKELEKLELPFKVEEIRNGPWVWLGAEVYCEKPVVTNEMVKINLGSFVDTIGYGWENWDILPIQQHITPGHKFKQWDVRRGLPVAENSVDLYRISHLIEHLTLEDVKNVLLREVYRTLKPGGVARISTPDARLIVRHYLSDDMSFFNIIQPPEYIAAPTEGEKLSRILFSGDYSHRAVYDDLMLIDYLREAGFSPSNIFRCAPGFSHSPVMQEETKDQHIEISLVCEAIK
jgi:ubiquinone/menaquinone biosynthesis C-methylase UbiE